MSPEPLPSLLDWHLAVRRCNLTQQARLVALTLAGHVDARRREALAYPSMVTLAAETGMSRRRVQEAVRELEAVGVVTFARRSKGRGSHLFRLHLDRLRTLTNPARPAGLETQQPTQQRPQPGTPCHVTRHHMPTNPAPPAGLPGTTCRASSNHPSIDLAREHKSEDPPGADGMDGPNKEADPNNPRAKAKALRQYGIKGPNLAKLAAAPSITLAMILDEWERIGGAEGIRNRPATLAAALAAHAGLQLGSGRISTADLDPDALRVREEAEAAQAKLEAMRRQRQMDAVGAN